MPIPATAKRDYSAMAEADLVTIARNREATARFGWSPYMHDPKLKGRLHRIRVPTLVLWGASDRIASPEYGRAYAAAIPGARFGRIERAGHFPHLEAARRIRPPRLDLRRGPRSRAMKVFHFTEQPYPDAWNEHEGSLRVVLPNRNLDPKIAAERFHRYYDEWQLADELGYDIMVNEHHSTATCMSSTVVVTLSVLARETKRARLLVLGYPIAHRPDPLRCAEELATIDVVSRGRLEMGFVKGVPYEIPVANTNPVFIMERFWEAHDFIIKAMTSHDAPFNWEGEYLPVPPRQHLAAPLSAAASAGMEHDEQPLQRARPRREGLCHRHARQRLQHAGAVRRLSRRLGVGGTDRARRRPTASPISASSRSPRPRTRRAGAASWSRAIPAPRRSSRRPSAIRRASCRSWTMPGCCRARRRRAASPRTAASSNMATASVQELIDAAIMFCGTPDQVYAQIADFTAHCGGLGNLLMMGQAGHSVA